MGVAISKFESIPMTWAEAATLIDSCHHHNSCPTPGCQDYGLGFTTPKSL